MPVRTRFAPSPTGYLHVGGLRTALYAYLFARQRGGTFILRIEDTDQSRKVEGAMERLIEALEWAGLQYDEGPLKGGAAGPYIQSQRLPLYREHAERLIAEGNAYRCFCTPQRLETMRSAGATKYDRLCRSVTADESRTRAEAGEQHVVRMVIPDGGDVVLHDEIRGDVSFAMDILDDQVLLKSDGFPTYHLAVVVDDHHMGVTHVIRGEEWLPSTPKHVLLYRYFGWDIPSFSHLPLLLNPDRSKLSKRQGDVAVEDYRDKGYLKEALVNFVAFLGWNPGDEREIFTLEGLVKEFSLERVGKAGAVFNIEKLNWMNQQHLKLKNDAHLLPLVRPLLAAKGYPVSDDAYLVQVIGLLKERVVLVNDFAEAARYFFCDPEQYDETARSKNWKPETGAHVRNVTDAFEASPSFDAVSLEAALRSVAERLGVGAGKLIHPVRLAVSGLSNGPSLFHLLQVLGRETVVRRLRTAVERLG